MRHDASFGTPVEDPPCGGSQRGSLDKTEPAEDREYFESAVQSEKPVPQLREWDRVPARGV
jgi:hypothetical protein